LCEAAATVGVPSSPPPSGCGAPPSASVRAKTALAATATDRAVSPAVGVVLVVALTVVLASGVAVAFAVGVAPEEPAPSARIALDVDAASDELVLEHRGGDALHVGELRVVVTVDGTRLRHQPPVPFFAATGFEPGPTGPFNRGYDDAWTAGTTASVALAGTNVPTIAPGDRVVVAIYADDALVARTSATADSSTAHGVSPTAHTVGLTARGVVRTRRTSTVDPEVGQASASTSDVAVASTSTSSSGTRATVVMAMSGSYDGPIRRCVTSSKPASWNIRSASSSS
jgi:FlaG/FlaF family flagellin (archaellin)